MPRCIFDSHRVAIDLNKFALLADKSWSVSEVEIIAISSLEINYLDRRKKWLAVFWSFVTPGLGHLYLGRLPSGFYILIWWTTVLTFSHLLPSIHYTFLGDFEQAVDVLNEQWVLFLPSMYGFASYDAYLNCDNYNKLLAQKQSHYLMKMHQSPTFKPKSGSLFAEGDQIMNVVAGFKHSIYLELALKELETNGIPREDVYAIPLLEKERPRSNRDIIRGQGFSLMDGTFACGTVFAVLGVIYGYVLKGGPVLWGLIGLASGWGFGFLFDFMMHKKRLKKGLRREGAEVMVVIHCAKEQISNVKKILFDHDTLGLQVLEEEFKSNFT
jgi:TM2 domain-containing membrane protein YozV